MPDDRDDPIAITLEDNPAEADIREIGRALSAHNAAATGDDAHRRLAVFLRDRSGGLVGGLVGMTFWGWLAIDLFWVAEGLRGRGYGSRLLAMAEAEAVRRGCTRALLDTLSFQAPRFYLARGYEVFGELDGFPGEHRRFYLTKRLAERGS